MPVSGLVVSLNSDPQLRAQAITAIGQESRIEIGVIERRRMAIVMDTASTNDDKRLWCWLSSLPGVVHIDVAMVGFEEPIGLKERSEAVTRTSNLQPPEKDNSQDGR